MSKIDIQEVTDEERPSEMPSEKQRETMEKDVVDKMEYLCKQDSPKRRLIDKIDQIERMTDENFKAVFDAFLQTTGKSQRHNDEQEEFRGEVQKQFNKLRRVHSRLLQVSDQFGSKSRLTVSQKHTQCYY